VILAAVFVLVASGAVAQTVGKNVTTTKQPLRSRSLDLTEVEAMPGLPAATSMNDSVCSSDGDIFMEVYGVAGKPGVAYFPEVYSISELRKVKKIDLPAPAGYPNAILDSLFAADGRVAGLIQASRTIDAGTPQSRTEMAFFLTVVDREGGQPSTVRLDLPFKPRKVAILGSGKFLVLGEDTANLKPIVAMLHEDGTLDRIVDIDTRATYGSSGELGQEYKSKPGSSNTAAMRRVIQWSLNAAEFVPWGREVLLVQPGSQFPVYRFNEAGLQGTVGIKLPDGLMLSAILGSGEKDSWVVVTKDAAAFAKLASSHVVENPTQHLFEVNPESGKVIDQLSVKGPQPGEVACAANGRLAVIYYGFPEKENVPNQLGYAFAPR